MNWKEYVLFVIETKCNSKCNFCDVGGFDGELIDLSPISLPMLTKVLKVIPVGKYSGIIFSGGEVTLNKELPEYASFARDRGFRHIMIQTNARALSDLRLAKKLKASGINEFFVSFHSADKELSEKISGRVGSYGQTVKALENLEKLGLMVITNTVMTSMNYKDLPKTGKFLAKFSNIELMQFWGYMPMSSKASELILPYGLAAPYLNKTLKFILNLPRRVGVKWFPVCLLDEAHKKHLKRELPICLGVKENFHKRGEACDFHRCSCCEETDCWGIPEMYKRVMPPGSWMPSVKD